MLSNVLHGLVAGETTEHTHLLQFLRFLALCHGVLQSHLVTLCAEADTHIYSLRFRLFALQNCVSGRVHTKSWISNSRTFKNIFGGKTIFFKNISGASSAHFIYNTINRAISSRETKALTEVGAVKNVNNGYYRKNNRHSILLRAEVI